jgi:hypothetical protein
METSFDKAFGEVRQLVEDFKAKEGFTFRTDTRKKKYATISSRKLFCW